VRILGIDTSLRSTGVAVIEQAGSRLSAVEYGTVKTPQKRLLSECLRRLHEGVDDILSRCAPEAAAKPHARAAACCSGRGGTALAGLWAT